MYLIGKYLSVAEYKRKPTKKYLHLKQGYQPLDHKTCIALHYVSEDAAALRTSEDGGGRLLRLEILKLSPHFIEYVTLT